MHVLQIANWEEILHENAFFIYVGIHFIVLTKNLFEMIKPMFFSISEVIIVQQYKLRRTLTTPTSNSKDPYLNNKLLLYLLMFPNISYYA